MEPVDEEGNSPSNTIAQLLQLTRSLTTSAPRCLIHLTCLLYTVLNVVNSILWQTHYTTTSSSMPGQEYFCIHAPQKTSVTFHKRKPMGTRLLLGQ